MRKQRAKTVRELQAKNTLDAFFIRFGETYDEFFPTYLLAVTCVAAIAVVYSFTL